MQPGADEIHAAAVGGGGNRRGGTGTKAQDEIPLRMGTARRKPMALKLDPGFVLFCPVLIWVGGRGRAIFKRAKG